MIQEIILDNEKYPYQQFYRQVRSHSFDDMRARFHNEKENKVRFPIFKVCIDNYENFVKLRSFYPIIEFTNYMLQKFKHMITREDARAKPIKNYF